jgi:hypothetical protein
MRKAKPFLMRAPLLIVALALAVVFVGREVGSPPAEATTFNPLNSVSVSDPTPGAHADLIISFSVDVPDSFPNITNAPTLQFIPKQWGINTDASLGTIAGQFSALSTVALVAQTPCMFPIAFTPDMYVASTDLDDTASQFDLLNHPGGPGYSGQFAPDPGHPDGIPAGITHYPDFLKGLFPSAGAPIMRLWGGDNVILTAVSMNIITYAPGQLAAHGHPAKLGYPTVVVVLNPFILDFAVTTATNDLCMPLALINTNYGISLDNPDTAADEGGIPLMTNPKVEKDHVFTLIAESQADACHGDDPAPPGLFGVGACGGVGDGKADTNPYDDAPMSKNVTVGSP